MKAPLLEYNDDLHEYRINGNVVPSVTQITGAYCKTVRAGEWHMQRGKAVHACAELIAKGINFMCDPQIEKRVSAIKRFFDDVKPEVIHTEQQVYSVLYQYAGTLDLLCHIDGKLCIMDYKGTMEKEALAYQCAGYSFTDQVAKLNVRHCAGLEPHDDGTYKFTGLIPIKMYQRGFLAMLTVYGIQQANKWRE